MTELHLIKRNGLLVPCSEKDEEILQNMTNGAVYVVKVAYGS